MVIECVLSVDCFIVSFLVSQAFIIPQEVPSLLSLIYSNIPPIKKGTDSRIGFGYRLGEHADFQVQFELGPQKETQAIGSGSTNKRAISSTDSFKAERDAEKQALREKAKQGSWLDNWFGQLKKNEKAEAEEKSGPVPSQPMISQDALNQLRELYKKPDEAEVKDSADEEPTSE
jgi:hypothetical protein